MLLLDRNIWPPWFSTLTLYLETYDLGDCWKDVLGCLSVWEGRAKFKEQKGPKFSLSSTGCPEEAAVWIKNYCRIYPMILSEDIYIFAECWWNWWKSLQLAWQKAPEIVNPMEDNQQVGLGSDWTVLQKMCQNGLVSVIACLAWWARQC